MDLRKAYLRIAIAGGLAACLTVEMSAQSSSNPALTQDAESSFNMPDPETPQSVALDFLAKDSTRTSTNWLSGDITRLSLNRGESSQTSLSLRLDKIDQRDAGQRAGWYLFAGADDEALTMSSLTAQDIELRDHVTIGDIHVGLAFPAGIGQASLGYARRSVEFESRTFSTSVEEDVLGLSYGLKF